MRLHEMSIGDIQQALSAGELSARDIARQTLEAIARVNPQIGAWTAVTEERMLAEAGNIDTLRREKRPPAAGGRALRGEEPVRRCRPYHPRRG